MREIVSCELRIDRQPAEAVRRDDFGTAADNSQLTIHNFSVQKVILPPSWMMRRPQLFVFSPKLGLDMFVLGIP